MLLQLFTAGPDGLQLTSCELSAGDQSWLNNLISSFSLPPSFPAPRFPPKGKEKSVYRGCSSAARKKSNRGIFDIFLLNFWNDDQKLFHSREALSHSTEVRNTAEIHRCNDMLMKTCCSLQKQGLPISRSDFLLSLITLRSAYVKDKGFTEVQIFTCYCLVVLW